jgi:hypothetical protein
MTELVIPRGQLVRSRVVPDIRAVLVDALDRDLTGYAVVEPQETLLLDGDGKAVFTFEDGIPVLVYHTSTDTGGKNALAALATVGPCRLDLYTLSVHQLEAAHDTPELRVPPGMPAEHLVGDSALAARTRKRVSTETEGTGQRNGKSTRNAVEAFLDDTEQIEAIREQARTEAKRRAKEWGLDDQLEL